MFIDPSFVDGFPSLPFPLLIASPLEALVEEFRMKTFAVSILKPGPTDIHNDIQHTFDLCSVPQILRMTMKTGMSCSLCHIRTTLELDFGGLEVNMETPQNDRWQASFGGRLMGKGLKMAEQFLKIGLKPIQKWKTVKTSGNSIFNSIM